MEKKKKNTVTVMKQNCSSPSSYHRLYNVSHLEKKNVKNNQTMWSYIYIPQPSLHNMQIRINEFNTREKEGIMMSMQMHKKQTTTKQAEIYTQMYRSKTCNRPKGMQIWDRSLWRDSQFLSLQIVFQCSRELINRTDNAYAQCQQCGETYKERLRDNSVIND